jgi:hypothetical protein
MHRFWSGGLLTSAGPLVRAPWNRTSGGRSWVVPDVVESWRMSKQFGSTRVAKQLNMDPKALVALFQSMGVGDVRNHMSTVDTGGRRARSSVNLERQKTR